MKLNSGEFQTRVTEIFEITIKQESDCSLDGGHTFEDVENTFELDVYHAKHLITELQEFCAEYS